MFLTSPGVFDNRELEQDSRPVRSCYLFLLELLMLNHFMRTEDSYYKTPIN